MTDEEAAARTRAWKYGRAKEAASAARVRLDNLVAKLAAGPSQAQVDLEEIVRLAANVPDGLVTRGNQFMQGGQHLRDLIVRECTLALNKLQRDRKALEDSLPEAREKCRQAEAYLATFED
jgi:hypothetical protein